MVKCFAPCLSLDASGTLGNAITFSKWKGRHYCRERIIPANPRSGLQVGFRAAFAFLAQEWAAIASGHTSSYNDLADSMAISPFNAYMRANQRRWRNYRPPSNNIVASEDGTLMIWNGGAPAAVGGPSNVTLSMTPDTVSTNWGVAIFRSVDSGFTPGLSNCIALLHVKDAEEHVYVDSPLAADTYYYDTRMFTIDGRWGALDGEINGTAT